MNATIMRDNISFYTLSLYAAFINRIKKAIGVTLVCSLFLLQCASPTLLATSMYYRPERDDTRYHLGVLKAVFLSLIWGVLKINTHPGVLIENTTEIQKFRGVSKFRTNTMLVNCRDQSDWASMMGRIDFENTTKILYPRNIVREKESVDF